MSLNCRKRELVKFYLNTIKYNSKIDIHDIRWINYFIENTLKTRE